MTVIEIPDDQAAALKARAAAQGLTLKAWLAKLAEESPAASPRKPLKTGRGMLAKYGPAPLRRGGQLQRPGRRGRKTDRRFLHQPRGNRLPHREEPPAGERAYADLTAALADPDHVFKESPFTVKIDEAMREVPRVGVPDMPDRIVAATGVYFGVPVISRDGRIRASNLQTIC